MCPLFDKLDEIYGTRSSISPPSVHDSAAIEIEISSTHSSPLNQNEGLSFDDNNMEADPYILTSKDGATCDTSSKNRKRKQGSESGLEALASTAKLRFEAHQDELSFKRQKLDLEKTKHEADTLLQREKFEYEKSVNERKLTLEEKKLQNDFELAKFRIEQETKLKLELAKLEMEKRQQ